MPLRPPTPLLPSDYVATGKGLVLLEFTEVDSCQGQGKSIDEEQGGRIVLVVSFVLEERIDRRVFW